MFIPSVYADLPLIRYRRHSFPWDKNAHSYRAALEADENSHKERAEWNVESTDSGHSETLDKNFAFHSSPSFNDLFSIPAVMPQMLLFEDVAKKRTYLEHFKSKGRLAKLQNPWSLNINFFHKFHKLIVKTKLFC